MRPSAEKSCAGITSLATPKVRSSASVPAPHVYVVLYDNVFCAPDAKLPPFDGVFFASASAVESFLAQYGASKLRGKELYVMGQPTRSALPARLAAKARMWSP